MGMTIDKIIKRLLWFEDYNEEDYCGGDRIQDEYGDWFYKVTEEDFEAFRQAADIMRKYQQLQSDYENRLKADMVAMLTEIQLEIEEKSIIDYDEDLYDGGECVISVSEINEIIQQKIDSLKMN
jgi:hypothetical protein